MPAERADLNIHTVQKIEAGQTMVRICTVDRLQKMIACDGADRLKCCRGFVQLKLLDRRECCCYSCRMMSNDDDFWNPDELVSGDALNDEIWTASPAIQRDIQPSLLSKGQAPTFATQQILYGSPELPWCPDFVGSSWKESDGILIIGAAYANFIGTVFPVSMYRSSTRAEEFCRAFLTHVVPAYRAYYNGIRLLLPADVTLSKLTMTDLCRAAFVKILNGQQTTRGYLRDGGHIPFKHYVEHPVQQDWLWRRIHGSSASTVIVLGTTAEHGLLRLFRHHNARIECSVAGKAVSFSRRAESWPNSYAHNDRKIQDWAGNEGWWNVLLESRRWRIVTVPHPSQNAVDAMHQNRVHRAWEQGGGSIDLASQKERSLEASNCSAPCLPMLGKVG
jgi:hypothetical protein